MNQTAKKTGQWRYRHANGLVTYSDIPSCCPTCGEIISGDTEWLIHACDPAMVAAAGELCHSHLTPAEFDRLMFGPRWLRAVRRLFRRQGTTMTTYALKSDDLNTLVAALNLAAEAYDRDAANLDPSRVQQRADFRTLARHAHELLAVMTDAVAGEITTDY